MDSNLEQNQPWGVWSEDAWGPALTQWQCAQGLQCGPRQGAFAQVVSAVQNQASPERGKTVGSRIQSVLPQL